MLVARPQITFLGLARVVHCACCQLAATNLSCFLCSKRKVKENTKAIDMNAPFGKDDLVPQGQPMIKLE